MNSNSRIIYFLIIIGLLLISTSAFCQKTRLFKDSKHRIGFVYIIGGQNFNQLLGKINDSDAKEIRDFLISKGVNPDKVGLNVSYKYKISLFQLQYYWAFLRKKTWGLELLVQPQYNITRYRPVDNMPVKTNGHEFGVNVGLLIRKNILKDFFSLYICISAGPHYVSGTPERQSEGFIFSDNLFVGLNFKLLKTLYLDIRPGIRHISNAGLTRNNGGVNNFVIGGGFLINL